LLNVLTESGLGLYLSNKFVIWWTNSTKILSSSLAPPLISPLHIEGSFSCHTKCIHSCLQLVILAKTLSTNHESLVLESFTKPSGCCLIGSTCLAW
jgi:hypothetical protein